MLAKVIFAICLVLKLDRVAPLVKEPPPVNFRPLLDFPLLQSWLCFQTLIYHVISFKAKMQIERVFFLTRMYFGAQ